MSSLVIILIMLVFLIGVGLFVIWFGRLWLQASAAAEQTQIKLNTQGIPVQAEIVNQRTVVGSRQVGYYITYQYGVAMPDGTTKAYTSEDRIKGDDYHNLKLGDHIGIRYLPDDPKVVYIELGARSVYTPGVLRFGGIFTMILGVGVILFGIVLGAASVGSDNQKSATSTAYMLQLSATPNIGQKTATAQAATATMQADLYTADKIRQALTPRIPGWKKVTDKVMHRVLPPETDLQLGEIEIDYGYCADGYFYTYAWLRVTDRLNLGNEIDTFFDGYGYVEGSEPAKCYPKELSQVWLRDSGKLGDSWFAVSGATEVKTKK